MTKKIGRNDPCPCGSGKKYKNCCFNKTEQKSTHTESGKKKFKARVISVPGSGGGIFQPGTSDSAMGFQMTEVDYTKTGSVGESLLQRFTAHAKESAKPIKKSKGTFSVEEPFKPTQEDFQQ